METIKKNQFRLLFFDGLANLLEFLHSVNRVQNEHGCSHQVPWWVYNHTEYKFDAPPPPVF